MGKTEAEALDEVLPTRDTSGKRINRSRARDFAKWKEIGWYPPSPEELSVYEMTSTVSPEDFPVDREPLPEKETAVNDINTINDVNTENAGPEMSDAEALRRAKQILESVETEERSQTWRGHSRDWSPAVISARIPKDLKAWLSALPGSTSVNIERFVKFAKTVMDSDEADD